MMANMDTGFKKFTSIYNRLAMEMNDCLEEKDIPNRWLRKDYSDPVRRVW